MSIFVCVLCGNLRARSRNRIATHPVADMSICPACIANAVQFITTELRTSFASSPIELAWYRAAQLLAPYTNPDTFDAVMLTSSCHPALLYRQISNDNA